MSARRSGRAKAPVKYTSDSEGSDFGDKKPRKKSSSTSATPKKRAAAAADPTPKKRAKKDPATLAAEHSAKASQQEAKAGKAAHKKTWDDWLAAHDAKGELLDEEPGKDVSITQTDAGKKHGLKKEDLAVLKHFEKRNPVYNNTIKLFFESEVRTLGFRKAGTLDGVEGGEAEVLKRGEEIWTEEHKDDPKEEDPKTPAKKTDKPKTPKQKWTVYIESHTVSSPDGLKEEPESSINQSDCKAMYNLTPADLAVLPYFGKANPKYGNTTKLFAKAEVERLAWRKAAVVGGVEEADDVALVEKGKELFDRGKEE